MKHTITVTRKYDIDIDGDWCGRCCLMHDVTRCSLFDSMTTRAGQCFLRCRKCKQATKAATEGKDGENGDHRVYKSSASPTISSKSR